MTDTIIENCGCCGNSNCSHAGCAACLDRSISNPLMGVGGLFQGYGCLGGRVSYLTHESVDGSEGVYTHGDGNCFHSLYNQPCTTHINREIMISFEDFQMGFQGCVVPGGSYILKNYGIDHTYGGNGGPDCWPFVGGLPGCGVTAATCSGVSPCASDLSEFPEETYPSCRWEFGGASYNFFDGVNNIEHLRTCTTYSSPCAECSTTFSYGIFNITTVQSRHGHFTIVFEPGFSDTSSGQNIRYARISISVGNVKGPMALSGGGCYSDCHQSSAAYKPEVYPAPYNEPHHRLINCTGETIFTKFYNQTWPAAVATFPDTMTLTVLPMQGE